jgi:hypothetical protein
VEDQEVASIRAKEEEAKRVAVYEKYNGSIDDE